MIALVTGAAGFLGSRLVRALTARGAQVRALDLPRAAWSRLDALAVTRIHADIVDAASVEAATLGATHVFHVAALYELGTPDVARMHAINVGGTENVLAAAARVGALAVHVSSVAALGPTGPELVTESHWNPETPRSAYAATKREAHLVARRFAQQGRVRIGLPATIFGAGDPSLFGAVHGALRGAPLVPVVRPELRLCFVHVEDCAEGLLRIAERGHDGGEYVLSTEVLSIADWMTAFARAQGIDGLRVRVPDRAIDLAGRAARALPERLRARVPALRTIDEATSMSAGVHWAFDGRRARRDLGWSPAPLVERLREGAAVIDGARRSERPSPA